jgi:dihydrofolate reductase
LLALRVLVLVGRHCYFSIGKFSWHAFATRKVCATSRSLTAKALLSSLAHS